MKWLLVDELTKISLKKKTFHFQDKQTQPTNQNKLQYVFFMSVNSPLIHFL